MKIGILTQPLYYNYGGIMQAYALQRFLSERGHEVWLIQRDGRKVYDYNLLFQWKYRFNSFVKSLLGVDFTYKATLAEEEVFSKEIVRFIDKNIPRRSPRLLTGEALKQYVYDNQFEGIVVGSDQVWNPSYSPCISNYFLDFCEHDNNLKKIAYAASFGVSEWAFSPDDTKRCRQLAASFDAISVRETSGIELCRDYLGVQATHVLDPTFFYSREDYIDLAQEGAGLCSEGDFFCYILDASDEKRLIIKNIEQNLGLTSFSVGPKLPLTRRNVKRNLSSCILPSAAQWLNAFQKAEMVFTDSFHGCVFSIIFQVPFWVVLNDYRGRTRFESILKLFGLENRIIYPGKQSIEFDVPIQWDTVRQVKEQMLNTSVDFLSTWF